MYPFWLNSRGIECSVVPGFTLGSPTAIALTRSAAFKYPSSSSGDVLSDVAILSNPNSAPSVGSRSDTSRSTASRSRIAFAYSARFKRCTTKRPGVTRPAHARSSDPASQPVKPTYSASLGRGMPGGGIARTLNFRRTLSQVPAWLNKSSKLATSKLIGSSDGDALRLLWHATQYLSNIARYLTASAVA